ncbi:2-dehydropantoate 2-reductase [Streptomyces sp. NPDC002668]|uniref:ketopantoate reductase family protein n=1 Tax=Streptomyces sp. NPDC002668 TaxID=3154422 RepID=UPI0033346E45
MVTRRLRVAVVGPGGIGGLLAAVLARGGAEVTCVAREHTATRLAAQGITVRSTTLGNFTVPIAAVTSLSRAPDVCLVTVKSPALEAAMATVAPAALGDAAVIPLLNGVEHLDTLRSAYGADRVIAGTIRVEAARLGSGFIEHSTPFADIQLAPTAPHPALPRLADALTAAGVGVAIREDPVAMLWDKLAFLAPFALATARRDAPIGRVRDRHRGGLLALVADTIPVARAHGAIATEESVVAFLDALPDTMTSSLHRDLDAGLPSELDAIGGAVLRAAARLGLALPTAEEYIESITARDAVAAREARR